MNNVISQEVDIEGINHRWQKLELFPFNPFMVVSSEKKTLQT